MRVMAELLLHLGVAGLVVLVFVAGGYLLGGVFMTVMGGLSSSTPDPDKGQVSLEAAGLKASWNGPARIGILVAGLLIIFYALSR